MSIFGDILNTGLGIIQLANQDTQQKYQAQLNKWQQNFATQQFDWQKDFAEQQFEYQKQMNQLSMSREDDAIQRRSADLQAAGLNPNLAVGSAASSQSYGSSGGTASANAHTQATVPGNPQFNAKFGLAQEYLDLMQRRAQINQMNQQTSLLASQQEYYNELSGNVSEQTSNVRARTQQVLYDLQKSQDLNLRTGDYGAGIVREVVTALEILQSGELSNLAKTAGTVSKEFVKPIADILMFPDHGVANRFLQEFAKPDGAFKGVHKSIKDGAISAKDGIKKAWLRFREKIQPVGDYLNKGADDFSAILNSIKNPDFPKKGILSK